MEIPIIRPVRILITVKVSYLLFIAGSGPVHLASDFGLTNIGLTRVYCALVWKLDICIYLYTHILLVVISPFHCRFWLCAPRLWCSSKLMLHPFTIKIYTDVIISFIYPPIYLLSLVYISPFSSLGSGPVHLGCDVPHESRSLSVRPREGNTRAYVEGVECAGAR